MVVGKIVAFRCVSMSASNAMNVGLIAIIARKATASSFLTNLQYITSSMSYNDGRFTFSASNL